MTLKDFIETKNVGGFDLVGSILINVIAEGVTYGLDVDTSNIEAGTLLEYTDVYDINDSILTINGIEYDMDVISLL